MYQTEHKYMRKTQIEITDVSPEKISFVLKNTDLSFANALRRVLIAEVPTLAIERVYIEENTSPLPDFMIAQRLGLIPITCENVDDFKYTGECECESGCSNCTIHFELDKEGKMKKNNKPTSIISEDIVIDDERVKVAELAGDAKPKKSEQILIAQLRCFDDKQTGHPQRIKLHGEICKGIGKIHAKWSPVSTVAMHAVPHVALDSTQIDVEDALKICAACPRKVFRMDGKTLIKDDRREGDCMLCEECCKKADEIIKKSKEPMKRFITVSESEDTFCFTLESSGSMKAIEILLRGLKVLKNKLDKFSEGLENYSRGTVDRMDLE